MPKNKENIMRIFFLLLFLHTLPLSALASLSEFKLDPGEYLLVANYQLGGKELAIAQTDRVTLSQSEGTLVLKNIQQPEFPIVVKQVGNEFIAHMNDAAGSVEFSGKLVADNHVVGQMSGHSEKQGDLSGSFQLKRVAE